MSKDPRLHVSLARWRDLAKVAVAVAFLSACQSGADVVSGSSTAAKGAGADAQLENSYRLGSGDHVRITVFGQDQMTGEYTVDGTGNLAFPLIGQIRAGGLTADQLSHAVEAKLEPDYLKNPHVSTEVLTYRPFYIVGEVKSPGSYPYVSGMTMLNAVALAGGYTYRAREDSFYVTRNGGEGAKEKIGATPNTPVLPGDIITVRERYF
jgi:polysaccharide export outer membrane protein